MNVVLMLLGVGMFALAGYDADTWTETHHAADMIAAFVDVGLGLWWLALAYRGDA